MNDICTEVEFTYNGNKTWAEIPDPSWPGYMMTAYSFVDCKSEEEAKWLCGNLNKALERVR